MGLKIGRVHVIILCGVWVGVDGVPLLLHSPKLVMTHHDGIDDEAILESELILPKLTHTFIGVDTDIARGGLKIAP